MIFCSTFLKFYLSLSQIINKENILCLENDCGIIIDKAVEQAVYLKRYLNIFL